MTGLAHRRKWAAGTGESAVAGEAVSEGDVAPTSVLPAGTDEPGEGRWLKWERVVLSKAGWGAQQLGSHLKRSLQSPGTCGLPVQFPVQRQPFLVDTCGKAQVIRGLRSLGKESIHVLDKI